MDGEQYMKCTYCGTHIGMEHLICPRCGDKTYPKTYVGQLIADKWFLSLDELSRRTGTIPQTIKGILKGESYGRITEMRLVKYLENYKGEWEESKKCKDLE